ncbi:MAG: anti-sigma factor domain-containing protein [Flavipsychrobacter sp.]
MNIKEYIESGILEAYVLGALTEGERAAVEADMVMYPELAQEIAAIEAAMQSFAEANAEEPPAHMQQQIWNAIQQHSAPQSVPEPQPAQEAKPQPKVVEFAPPAATARPSWQRAAVWAAVGVSVLTNFMLLSQRNKTKEEIAQMTSQMDSLKASQQQVLAEYKKGRDMLVDTSMKTVVMRSMQPGKEMTGMMFWSKVTGESYLTIHAMPMPEKGKQYQLWVIQDGKPVSMGVIDNNLVANAGMMYKIPMQVKGGQAFAISLEKEGGNPTPTEVMAVGAI